MAKQCTTEKSLERQNRIGKALEEMMMEQDYEDIFVSDLCTRAGISRRSFYRYFNGKDDVLRSLLEDIIRDCHLQAVFKFCPERGILNIVNFPLQTYFFIVGCHTSPLGSQV